MLRLVGIILAILFVLGGVQVATSSEAGAIDAECVTAGHVLADSASCNAQRAAEVSKSARYCLGLSEILPNAGARAVVSYLTRGLSRSVGGYCESWRLTQYIAQFAVYGPAM